MREECELFHGVALEDFAAELEEREAGADLAGADFVGSVFGAGLAGVATAVTSGSFLARRMPSASLVEKSFLLITATSPQ
jgi:hypothetical protein